MDSLLNVALTVLSELNAPKRVSLGPLTVAAICLIFALIAVAGALGCGVAALWIHLASSYGATSAALGSAVALILLGGVLILVARSLFREGPRELFRPAGTGDDLVTEIYRIFLRHKSSALLAALLAGVMTGRNGRVR